MYFLRLGTLGFGGPIALAAAMRRDLVEERRWITERDYVDGLALAQLAPGPLAAQLAMYIEWLAGGTWGSAVVGLAFVVPSFLMVIVLSIIYVQLGGLPLIQGIFYGMGAAVIAVIARSAVKLATSTLKRDALLWGIFAISALVTGVTESEIFLLFLGAGILTLAMRGWPKAGSTMMGVTWPAWFLTGLSAPATGGLLMTIGIFFAEAGAFVFGSGLAIVPFLHGGVVNRLHWLTEQQFLDAVAVAMITPGPVVITVAFIGFLVAGLAGACVAAAGVFLPCWLFVVIPAPHFHKYADDKRLRAFVDGVTAAATGAIAGAAFVLARRSLVDVGSVCIATASMAVLLVPKKVPEPVLVIAAGLVGLVLPRGH